MKKYILFISLSFLFQILIEAQVPSGLMVELFEYPQMVEITDSTPEFGWTYNSIKKEDFQTAYRIIVASSKRKIESNTGNVWDSKKIISNKSSNVEYRGKNLKTHENYYWKIKIWDKDSVQTNYSDYQQFNTGDLSKEYITNRYPLQQQKIKPVIVKQKNEKHYFIDFGKAAFGTIEITLNSKIKDTVEIHLGEKLASADSIDRNPFGTIRYRNILLPVRKGKHIYTVNIVLEPEMRNMGSRSVKMPPETGEVMPFRYCEVLNCPSVIDKSTIIQLAVFYPFNDNSSYFNCSDTLLNQVWELCKYSIKATSFIGIYVDGDRERIPYEGDAYINQLGHYCVDNKYNMARYSHEYLMKNPTWPTEWILHSILMAYADYMYTGNEESLRHNYKDLKAKTLIALEREDGLISTKTGLVNDTILKSIHLDDGINDIVDWPRVERDNYEMADINTVVNAFHYRNLALMIKLAKALNKNDDEVFFTKRAELVKNSINTKLFDKRKHIYVDGENSVHSSLHANMFALVFGIVPEKYVYGVANLIKSKGMVCSVYGAQYLLEGLYWADEGNWALGLLTNTSERSWWNMIRVGSTITLESWDNKYKSNIDWNHAWGAAPANIIPRCLWGIIPLEPGFSKFQIKPQVGNLKYGKIEVPSVKGAIRAEFKAEENRFFELNVEIPFNTRAKIYLPDMNKNQSYTINNVVKKGNSSGKYIEIEVGSGLYKFKVPKVN